MVDDSAVLEAQLATATTQDRTWLRQMLGRLEHAAAVGERPPGAGMAKRRALPEVAYTHQWAGPLDRATQAQTEALPLLDTATRGDTTHQHFVKRRFDQRDDTGAPAEPEMTRRVRTRSCAARILGVSSVVAAHRAPELAGR